MLDKIVLFGYHLTLIINADKPIFAFALSSADVDERDAARDLLHAKLDLVGPANKGVVKDIFV